MPDADPNSHVIDALQYSNWTREHFQEWRAGGLSAVGVTIAYQESTRETLSRLAAWNRRFREHADLIRPVRSGDDLDAARTEGRTGVFLGTQTPAPIEDEIGLVEVLADAGLKVMQLTYNHQSLLGAGYQEPEGSGLTRFGQEVIAEMNRVGLLVDLSHAGERTALEAIAASARPAAVTHANPRFFHDVPRNLSDRVLRALGESGGMLGFSLYSPHLPDGAATTLEAFTEMVARTAEITGVETLGIGSDMCRGWDGRTLDYMRNGRWRRVSEDARRELAARPWPEQPDWFRTPADMPRLRAGLRARGFGADEVAGLIGGNWARFLRTAFAPRPTAAEPRTGAAHPAPHKETAS
jgi:microsomal dipeptidase-like Zn-dependent dipeptidase